MALTSDQLQEAVAVATKYIRKNMASILTQSNYLYKFMVENKEFIDGGTKIQMPIVFQENDSNGFIDGKFDVISNNQNQQFTFAEIDWKYYYSNVSITLDDMTKTNDTSRAIKSLVMGKVQSAKASMVRDLTTSMHGSSATDSKKFTGFGDIFAASGTAYAGINNTDVANWLPEIDTTTTTVNYDNITGMISTLEERTSQYPADENGMMYRPEIMISRNQVIQTFKSNEQIKQRFQNSDTLKAGFKGVEVDGLFWYSDFFASGSVDGITADNFLFIISPASMKLFYKYGFGKDSPMDSKQQLVNQPVVADINYLAGNMGCDNRRVNGVFKTLIA